MSGEKKIWDKQFKPSEKVIKLIEDNLGSEYFQGLIGTYKLCYKNILEKKEKGLSDHEIECLLKKMDNILLESVGKKE